MGCRLLIYLLADGLVSEDVYLEWAVAGKAGAFLVD